MTKNTRAWRWGPLLALSVGALSSLHCIELPAKSFSCSTDGDCEGLKGPGGESYVCVSGGWCAGPEQSPGGSCPQLPTSSSCSTSNWCWDNPLSEGRTLFTVRGRSATDVWAVGDRGIALHWDGNCWSRQPPSGTQPLRAAWPAAGKTWWFGGNGGTLFKWDGSTWASQALAEQLIIHDIEGASETSAVAVGQSGALYTFNGQQWSAQTWNTGGFPPPDLLAVWPVSNTEAWAVGRGGTLVHGVDGRWSFANRQGSVDLMAIAPGANAGTAYAVGRGTLATYANSTWSTSGYATSATPLNGVWTSGGVTRIVGPASNIHVLGRSNEPSGTPQVLNSIWGNDEALWAVGAAGAIVRRGTTQWSEVPGGVTRALNGFWGTDDLNLWAAGDNDLIMRRENNLWAPVTPPEQGTFKAIWGSGDLLLVGTGGGRLLAFKNGQWTQETGDVLATSVNALWGTGPASVWAVGDNGLISRRNADGSWTSEGRLSTDRLNAIWGSSASDVWAVGNGGIIYHRDSAGWSRQKLPTTTDLFGVWGSGPNDVWAVGNGGGIYHYDGKAWTATPTQVGTPFFRAISGRSADSVWAVGDNGTIAFWNGKSWTAQVSGVDESLRSVWVTPSTTWVGGTNGTVLRLKP